MNHPHTKKETGLHEGRRLSSVLTPVYKLGFSAALVATGITCTYWGLKNTSFDPSFWVWPLSWLFVLLVGYLCLRLQKVVACSDHLVISNYVTSSRVPYDDIEEIRAHRTQNLMFVRLQLKIACRYGRSIHFLLPSTFAGIESQPEIQLLQEKCPKLRSRSRNKWSGTLYFRSGQ